MYSLLVADDNKVGRDAIAYLLRVNDMPFVVSQAKNGEEALKMIREAHFDCVITDIKMPRLSGTELIKIVSEEGPAPIFIICSGYRDFEDAKVAIEYGVQNYLLKPIAAADFIKTMNQVLGLLRENTLKQKSRCDDILCRELRGTNTGDVAVAELFSKTTRLVMACVGGDRPKAEREALHARIESAANSSVRVVSFDKTWDALLYFAGDKEPSDMKGFLSAMEKTYKELGSGQTLLCVSRHIAGAQDVSPCLAETLRWSEKKLFSAEQKLFYVEESEPESNETLTELENIIYKKIATGQHEEAKNCILTYLDVLSRHNKASALYTKFIISNFIKAILQRYSIQSGSMLLHIVEEIGYAPSVEALKKVIAKFIDNLMKENPLSMEDYNAVERAEKIIQAEYAGEMSLEQLSSRVYLSPSYLSRAFKRKTGINLFTYITNIRMEVGKRLLTQSNSKIADISKQVGYEDPAYFSRVFKQYYGMIPKLFRLAAGTNNPPGKGRE